MTPFDSVFQQIAALLALCAVIGFIGTRLRQPLVIAYIAAGILVGPMVLGWIHESEEVELLAEIGIAVLLFVVGLKLDLRIVRTLGPVALATGLGQVIFTSAIGYGLSVWLGYGIVPALYIAVALTFSSTVIIVKLLSDKDELDELHGRIAIGFLIVQDIVVVLVMIGLSSFAETGEGGLGTQVVQVFLTGAAFLAVIAALSRWVLPPLLHRLAHNTELLVLFAVAWAVALAAAGELLGFSEEVGAFLAGVSLASTTYRDALGARLSSLRDFLLLFFFINLGTQVDFGDAGAQITAAIVLSLFVLVGNPIIVMVIMGLMRYPVRVSFKAGLTVAQISEFSLILAALGLSLGQIDSDTVGLITTVGIITIGLSTYLIYNSDAIYARLARFLTFFERRVSTADQKHGGDSGHNPEVIVFGLGRYGTNIVRALRKAGHEPLGVDFDPVSLDHWRENEDLPVLYGDAHDPHVAEVLPLSTARWVVSSVRDMDANLSLIQTLRQVGYKGAIAVTAMDDDEERRLRDAGAQRVLRPFVDAAGDAVAAIGLAEEA
jgi:Kef-type K+ transport system membrane component KefB